MKLTEDKLASVRKNYPPSFSGDAEKRYLDHQKDGGAIWNIFYLHCLDPSTWPIFDQHTYRAMKYIQTGKIIEIGTTHKQKYESYVQEYRPFLKSLGQSDPRKTDKALFAFGQFSKWLKNMCEGDGLNTVTSLPRACRKLQVAYHDVFCTLLLNAKQDKKTAFLRSEL